MALKTKNELIFESAISEAQYYLSRCKDKKHDLGHAERVARDARQIGESLKSNDLKLLEVCGWWHDVGRLIDTPNHEAISAHMLRCCLDRMGTEEEICERAFKAVVSHGRKMHPATLEGKIIRDADKLEYISVERWQTCIKNGCTKRLNSSSLEFGNLSRLLELEPSRQLYRQRIDNFREYLDSLEVDDPTINQALKDHYVKVNTG